MKIVYLLSSSIVKAGTERILSDKMNYLTRNYGYEITFITYEQRNYPLAFPLDERIKVIELNVPFLPLFLLHSIKRVFAKAKQTRILRNKLHSVLKDIHPDYVVVTTYDFDKFEGILTLPYRFVIESHICITDVRQEYKQNNILTRLYAKILDKNHFRLLNKACCLVTLTNADKSDWEKQVQLPVYVIPNCVTCYPEDITPYSGRPQRIVCVGRLTAQKGFDYLIEAWSLIASKYPTWRIDIYGHGDLEDALHHMIKTHHLEDSISIHKPTSHIYDEYQNSSIYVLSSRFEGFGLVLVEAMSCGTPCVSFGCPHGPSELITHGEDGLLVPLADIKKLAEAMEWMMTHPEERQRMSLNARTKAQKYTTDHIMPQWKELFESILSRPFNQ